ncbi:MAG: orotidine-5'-phosphate decarboxylase [Bacteroidota bacterium]
MHYSDLAQAIFSRQSYLCVGLDSDYARLPLSVLASENPLLTFNKAIIQATQDYCVAYKINTAFYEALGAQGWEIMVQTIQAIPDSHFIIADAKRGDIGNTVQQYAKAFFEQLKVDAITVAPYMGADSVLPFLKYENKWVILLALTSNPSSRDFQFLQVGPEENTQALYQRVLQTSQSWAGPKQLMYVVGATQSDHLNTIREIIPRHFLLIPGVGQQGGSLEEISRLGLHDQGGLLVNASRSIIFASSGSDYAAAARKAAQDLQAEMKIYLEKYT